MNGIDTGNLIGALELGDHPASFDDGVLETIGAYALGPTQGCPTSGLACLTSVCRPHVDDSALEIAAEKVALGPTTGCPPPRTFIACVADDTMLRTAGVTMASPAPTTGLPCLPTTRCH
jgi:hypothetical protein